MPDIIHRIGIKAPVAAIHEAVTTTRGVAGWWTRETTGSAKLGGKLNALFRNPEGKEIGQMAFELTKIDANEVRWRFVEGPEEWLGTDVSFEMTQDGDMTVLIFGHRSWKEPVEFMAHCSMKWAVFLLSLRELVEKGAGKPAPDDMKIDNWN